MHERAREGSDVELPAACTQRRASRAAVLQDHLELAADAVELEVRSGFVF